MFPPPRVRNAERAKALTKVFYVGSVTKIPNGQTEK